MADDLNPKRCEVCKHWQHLTPEEPSAPEGICQHLKWKGPLWLGGKDPTFGYHPATLRRDNCQHFRKAAA